MDASSIRRAPDPSVCLNACHKPDMCVTDSKGAPFCVVIRELADHISIEESKTTTITPIAPTPSTWSDMNPYFYGLASGFGLCVFLVVLYNHWSSIRRVAGHIFRVVSSIFQRVKHIFWIAVGIVSAVFSAPVRNSSGPDLENPIFNVNFGKEAVMCESAVVETVYPTEHIDEEPDHHWNNNQEDSLMIPIMPRGKLLSEYEKKGQIDAKLAQGLSQRRISREMGRSFNVINRYASDPAAYGAKKSSGRPSILSDRDKRRIFRRASNSVMTCSKLKNELGLSASKETIRRVLSKSMFIKFRKMRKAAFLNPAHRKNRVDFAKKNQKTDWKKARITVALSKLIFSIQVIFSDEKKFNSDGPEGYRYYWHDLRKEKLRYSRRNFKGGGVMVWAAVSSIGRVKMCFVSKSMSGVDYRYVMRRGLMPFYRRNRGRKFIFMQDGASCHRAKRTFKWISNHGVSILDWPACSPDLNIMENVWGFMVKRIYEGNKSYGDVVELKKAIVEAWQEVDHPLLDNLYFSMDARVFEVTRRNGGPIDF